MPIYQIHSQRQILYLAKWLYWDRRELSQFFLMQGLSIKIMYWWCKSPLDTRGASVTLGGDDLSIPHKCAHFKDISLSTKEYITSLYLSNLCPPFPTRRLAIGGATTERYVHLSTQFCSKLFVLIFILFILKCNTHNQVSLIHSSLQSIKNRILKSYFILAICTKWNGHLTFTRGQPPDQLGGKLQGLWVHGLRGERERILYKVHLGVEN